MSTSTNAATAYTISRPDQWDDWIDQTRLYMDTMIQNAFSWGYLFLPGMQDHS